MKRYLKQGKYAFLEADVLGEGSFGKVYKALNCQNNSWVALKQISLAEIQADQEIEKEIILSEISVMRKFNKKMKEQPCPFLVKQEDVFRTDMHIYIAMQLCEGGTLEGQKDMRQLTEAECVKVLYCLLCGLEYMNQMKIVHRDLKPENVFISHIELDTGQDKSKGIKVYKIGDFGFAAQKQQFDIAMGTYPYMAPEMIKGGPYGPQVDVWSLGIIAYQIAFNGLYFIGRDRWQLLANIKQQPFILAEWQQQQISPAYYDFMCKCLNKQPRYRPNPSQLLNHPLFYKMHNQLAQIQEQIHQSPKQSRSAVKSASSLNTLFMNKSKSAGEVAQSPQKQAERVYQQQQAHQQIVVQLQPQQQQSVVRPASSSTFVKLNSLLCQCRKLRQMAELFATFQEQTARVTEFIQIYLLKDCYALMNRLAYSLQHHNNRLQLPQQEWEVIFLPQNSAEYAHLQAETQQQLLYVTGLFNEKYREFRVYCEGRFGAEQREWIGQVVNEEPYEETQGKLLERELRKWVGAYDRHRGEYAGHKDLFAMCEEVLRLKVCS